LENLDDALPAALAALDVEHDRLKAELEEEQAIVQEIESCDKAELEEFLAELEAQKYALIFSFLTMSSGITHHFL
jgi:hypothetical protein